MTKGGLIEVVAESTPHISKNPFGIHTAERDDLCYILVASIFFTDIFYNLITLVHTEVYIDIRHTDSFRV